MIANAEGWEALAALCIDSAQAALFSRDALLIRAYAESLTRKERADNGGMNMRESTRRQQEAVRRQQEFISGIVAERDRLREEYAALAADATKMALRLMGESDDTFSDDVYEVIHRWRPHCLAMLKGENIDVARAALAKPAA